MEQKINNTQQTIFCFMWSVYVLFDHLFYYDLIHGLGNAVLSFAAVFVMVRPSSFIRFLVMSVLLLYVRFEDFPDPYSVHMFLCYIFTFIFVLLSASMLVKNQETSKVWKDFLPMLRLSLLCLYFFVVLNKLNSAYFDIKSSCATFLLYRYHTWIPDHEIFKQVAIFASIITEALIPIFLIFRHTRFIGIIIGMAFHGIILYHGFYHFAAMLFPLYLLFIPTSIINKNSIKLGFVKGKLSLLKEFLLSLVILTGLVWLSSLTGERDLGRYLWLPYIVMLFVFMGWLGAKHFNWNCRSDKFLKIVSAPQWIFILFMVFNGINPYLGLKTALSFSMYSGLITEQGRTNHFFIPTEWQLFNYQKDLIRIDPEFSTDNKFFKHWQNADARVPFIKLKSYVLNGVIATDTPVDYWRKSKLFQVSRIGNIKEFKRDFSFNVLDRWLKFRYIYNKDPEWCTY